MTTFLIMKTRIASELRRSNMVTEIGNAINDAIKEAAKTRFYFNEYFANFNTVPGQEYYPDLGFTEIDSYWTMNGSSRFNVWPRNNIDQDRLAAGNALGGQLLDVSRYGEQFRLYPIPSVVQTVYLSGFGAMLPNPLVNDGDTNAWMISGEPYIRALAKSYLLKDVIRDFGEATVYEALSEDRKTDLLEKTTLRQTTDTIQGTQF